MCPTVQVGYVEAHLSVTEQISIQLLMLLSVCLRIDLMQKKKKKTFLEFKHTRSLHSETHQSSP